MRNFTLKSSFTTIRSVRYAFVFLLLISSTTVLAQQFHSTSPYMQSNDLQTEQYQGAEVGYHSTIYTPFSNETPSNNNAPAGISGRRNADDDGFGGNSDGGNQGNSYPLGDAWSLLIFAAIGAGVIFIKQRKNLKAKA